ncbi:MAG TPA: ParB/RepB/Spo0J family partition protein [Tenuifilaceae bacterium]|nr:ParB/RepB/Spo0J family partition protein [Tenuifilaceae bacterium]HPC68804.1 ParB/RepB/Spo0J family partition protein [Tenuifilaceae bacterium]HPK78447.1 ParB/RepB/Spo0J family partition protein [Tenuifilaceae bacterium]HQK65116.1 ParB/RepB/Spo0J family partition protein [Tenuifilaceae bacterium]HRS46421.1 ParB/RepB/Spo0J family partition protein [Tenuifilaceae bacterium]
MSVEPQGDTSPAEAEALEQLMQSIEINGLMQPITVREIDGRYELVDGHRRLLAHLRLGLPEIPALVSHYTDKQAQALTVIANLQRKNLNTIERALAFEKILSNGLFADRKELSQAIGKDETYVNDLLNTLSMAPRVVEHLAKTNAVRDARLLRMIRRAAPLHKPEGEQRQWELYMLVVNQNMNRSQLADHLKKDKPKQPAQWNIKFRQRQVDITLKTGKLTPERIEKIQELLAKKLEDLLEELS